ncbi:MAG: cytochrome C biogenesis protein CcsA [Betaproteobacteria bacterium]|nr:MAG: cytochrome C biogenesis protein CcsA [Betaproteobacteria bacterium]
MKAVLMAIAAAGLLAAGSSQAQTGMEVLKTKGCLGCHAFDKKKVGPAYKDVAAKHRGEKDAQAQLVAKIKAGNPHPKLNVTDAELNAAVKQVLSTK